MPASVNNEVLHKHLREIWNQQTLEAFRVVMGPPPPPLPWRARMARNLRGRWLDARVWIAEKILRLPQDGDLY